MFQPTVWALILLVCSAAAKKCSDLMIPVSITARQGVFNVATLEHNLDATTFNQNTTSIGGNFTDAMLKGYADVHGHYTINAQFCRPDDPKKANGIVQLLTHGIGFDKSYWDLPYAYPEYSYIHCAVDGSGYSTLAIDRFGIGKSSIADPLNIIQAPASMSAIYEVTKKLRSGTLPNKIKPFKKVIHVGHSFGSVLTYELVAKYPTISDGIILTGFSGNGTYVPMVSAGMNWQLANLNLPKRFKHLPGGYITWANMGTNQYGFFKPESFDPKLLEWAEKNKYPATVGEMLTLGSQPSDAALFKGPVMVFTGSHDSWFCGFDCHATGTPKLASIPAGVKSIFTGAKAFEAYIQPATGHSLAMHRNATGGFHVMLQWLKGVGL